jgi:hypothetical protein
MCVTMLNVQCAHAVLFMLLALYLSILHIGLLTCSFLQVKNKQNDAKPSVQLFFSQAMVTNISVNVFIIYTRYMRLRQTFDLDVYTF